MGVFHSALSFETCAGAVVSARVVVVWRGRRSRERGLGDDRGSLFLIFNHVPRAFHYQCQALSVCRHRPRGQEIL